MTARTSAWVWAALALLLAGRAAADPSAEEARKVKSAAAEGALDARPAPAGDPGPKGTPAPPRPAEELPPAARAPAWRAGARPPAEVPAEVVVRTASKKKAAAPAAEKAKAGDAADECEVEITWHAPGT